MEQASCLLQYSNAVVMYTHAIFLIVQAAFHFVEWALENTHFFQQKSAAWTDKSSCVHRNWGVLYVSIDQQYTIAWVNLIHASLLFSALVSMHFKSLCIHVLWETRLFSIHLTSWDYKIFNPAFRPTDTFWNWVLALGLLALPCAACASPRFTTLLTAMLKFCRDWVRMWR